MDKVKNLYINLLGNDITYGPEEGESNITAEMREIWEEVFNDITSLLKENALISEEVDIEQGDAWMFMTYEDGFSIDEGIKILHVLEKEYKVTNFAFETEYDEWDDEEPFVSISIYKE